MVHLNFSLVSECFLLFLFLFLFFTKFVHYQLSSYQSSFDELQGQIPGGGGVEGIPILIIRSSKC